MPGRVFPGLLAAGPWFTRLLYPTLYEASAPYILLANLGAVVSIAGNMAQPMILKCCSTRWILAIQLVYGGTYLLLAMALLPAYASPASAGPRSWPMACGFWRSMPGLWKF